MNFQADSACPGATLSLMGESRPRPITISRSRPSKLAIVSNTSSSATFCAHSRPNDMMLEKGALAQRRDEIYGWCSLGLPNCITLAFSGFPLWGEINMAINPLAFSGSHGGEKST